MTTDTLSPTDTNVDIDDDTDDEILTLTLPVLSAVLAARMHPHWWGAFSTAEQFAGDFTMADALAEIGERVDAAGGLLWNSELDAADAVVTGEALCDLGREAMKLATLWRSARQQLADAKAPEAQPASETSSSDDAEKLEALHKRLMSFNLDHFPFGIGVTLSELVASAQQRNPAELERAIAKLEKWTPRQVAAVSAVLESAGEGYAPAIYIEGTDHKPVFGMPEGLSTRFYTLMNERFPAKLAVEFANVVDSALQRDFRSMVQAIDAIERLPGGAA